MIWKVINFDVKCTGKLKVRRPTLASYWAHGHKLVSFNIFPKKQRLKVNFDMWYPHSLYPNPSKIQGNAVNQHDAQRKEVCVALWEIWRHNAIREKDGE